MSSWIKIILLASVVGLCAITIIYSLSVARRQAFAWIYPTRHQPTRTPADVGLSRWEEIRFETEDGFKIVGWFIQPDSEPETPPATVIFLHGLGGNRAALLWEASWMVKRGYNALLLDLRAHGDSDGQFTTVGYNEIYEVQGALEYLHTRSLTNHDVDPQRIGIYGVSLGGVIAMRAAARMPEIRAVVVDSSFKNVEDNTTSIVRALTGRPPIPFPAAVLWFINQETGVTMQEVRPIDDLAQIAPRPLLFIHGDRDFVIDARNSQEMYAMASEPKELFLIANGEHANLPSIDPAGYETRLATFYDQYLGGQP